VLIAEDDADLADVLRQALSDSLGIDTEIVANGALVMDSVTARRPDLVILDIALPGLNGLDVFDLLRSDPHWHGVPVLFLTGLPERAATANATMGTHEILAKPFDLDDLMARAVHLIAATHTTEVAA
jgi:DNA-binding response OmpR family regulator